jgi:hypothetical protein
VPEQSFASQLVREVIVRVAEVKVKVKVKVVVVVVVREIECVVRKKAVGIKGNLGIKEKVKSCEIDWIRVDTPSCVMWHEKRRGKGFFSVLIIIVTTVRYGPIRH